jgi:hypothetical protein
MTFHHAFTLADVFSPKDAYDIYLTINSTVCYFLDNCYSP